MKRVRASEPIVCFPHRLRSASTTRLAHAVSAALPASLGTPPLEHPMPASPASARCPSAPTTSPQDVCRTLTLGATSASAGQATLGPSVRGEGG